MIAQESARQGLVRVSRHDDSIRDAETNSTKVL